MLRTATSEAITAAAEIIRSGGLVAFPTETVYGLGANALDAFAAAKIFEAKARPTFDPLIVHIADEAMLHRVVDEPIPPLARLAMQRFWPGPLTLVLPKNRNVPDLVTAGLPTVAVRMPAHRVAHALVAHAGVPIAAPSANPFGTLSPTSAEHVEATLGDRIACILDDGPTPFGIESTILAFLPKPTILRPGAIPHEAIEEALGCRVAVISIATATPSVPGQLPQHYAPRIPLRIIDPASVAADDRQRAGLLAFHHDVPGYAVSRILSPSADLRQAAAQLFAFLHDLERSDIDRIDAQEIPEVGLGVAIMDRLRRAAIKS